MYLAYQIQTICDVYKLSYEELANKIGISRITIYNHWVQEPGRDRAVKTKNLNALCEVAAVSPSFFTKKDVDLMDFYVCSFQYMFEKLNDSNKRYLDLIKINIEYLTEQSINSPFDFIHSCSSVELMSSVWKIAYEIYRFAH